MTDSQFGAVLASLAMLVAAAHLLGYVCERLRQPRLVGEILAGVLLGRFVLGAVSPTLSAFLFGQHPAGNPTATVLRFTDQLGLLLLMFVAGSEARGILAPENRRPTWWLLTAGKTLPFLVTLGLIRFVSLESVTGPAGLRVSVELVLAVAVAVTSVPVISRIFYDLGILHTRFASLILGAAVLEDIVLWAVMGIATALAAAGRVEGAVTGAIATQALLMLGYLSVCLFLAPALLRRLHGARWNALAHASPAGYVIVLMLSYGAIAAALNVSIVFASLLAGFALVGGFSGSERARFAEPLAAVARVASGLFIPVYFCMVGYRLELGRGFSPGLAIVFLVGSSLLTLAAVSAAMRWAGFRGLDVVNLAVAANARGGPGIVLASVAFDAGIINGALFTTLVLTAIVTSQAAGFWLGHVLRRGWPLLRTVA